MTVAGLGKVSEEMYVVELESVVRLESEPGAAVQETPGMELMDVLESVVDSGHEQETVLGQYSEADTVLSLGVGMTALGWVVLQKGPGTQQLFGSELQAEPEPQAELGTGAGAGAGAELEAERSVAGLLQDSHLVTEMVAGFGLAAPGSGVIIYSVFVHLYLLLWWKQWWWWWYWPSWLSLPEG